jgi:hypothetical protein
MENSVFRISNSKLHLTYKTHIDFEDWLKWAQEKFGQILEYSMVHETGKDDKTSPYYHSHILVHFKERICKRSPSVFDYKLKGEDEKEYFSLHYWKDKRKEEEKINGIHPHIEMVTDKNHWDYIVFEYHKKEEGAYRISNILSEEDKLKIKEEEKLKKLALVEEEKKKNCKKCQRIKYAKKHTCGIIEYEEEKKKLPGLKELQERINEDRKFNAVNHYGGDDIRSIATIEKAMNYVRMPLPEEPNILWKPWQIELLKEMSGKALDRLIVWICDVVGKSGKSDFSKHLKKYYGVFVIDNLEKSTVAMVLKDFYENSGKKNIDKILVDLPRNYHMKPEYYQTLELLKSGEITSSKYHCKVVEFSGYENIKPHVIVLSNELPKFEYLTPDKLGIRIMDRKGNEIIERNEIIPAEIILPPGFQKPGTVLAKEYENYEEDEEDYWKPFNFNFDKEYIEKSKIFWEKYYYEELKRDKLKLKIIKERDVYIGLLASKILSESLSDINEIDDENKSDFSC